jgi:hypothetical protein
MHSSRQADLMPASGGRVQRRSRARFVDSMNNNKISVNNGLTTNPSSCDARLFERCGVGHAMHTVEARHRLSKDRTGCDAIAYQNLRG